MVGWGKKMEIEKKGNKIIIKHCLKQNETYRISKGSKFQSITIMKIPQVVSGFSNQTEDNKGIFVGDWDNCDLNVLEEDYELIQKLYKMPPGYLFQTKENNFHIISLKKFPHSKIYEMLLNTRCDENYKTMPLRSKYKTYVIRISGKKGSKKPKFIGMIGKNINLNYDVSEAHLKLLQKIYPKIPKINYKKLDGKKNVKIQKYETSI